MFECKRDLIVKLENGDGGRVSEFDDRDDNNHDDVEEEGEISKPS